MAFTIHSHVLCPGMSWLWKELISRLLGVGFTVPASSDGVTYNPAGNQITSGHRGVAPTPGSLFNVNAWIRLRHPTGAYELLVKKTSAATNADMYIQYSTAGFTGGSPGVTTAPTAIDAVFVWGTTTSGTSLCSGTYGQNASTLAHFIIGDADEDYTWVVYHAHIGDFDTNGVIWAVDRVTSMESEDDDPSVVIFNNFGASTPFDAFDTWTPDSNPKPFAFMSKYGSREQQMRVFSPMGPSTRITNTPLLSGWNPYSNNLQIVESPIWWWRRGTSTNTPANTTPPERTNLKGRSRVFYGPTGMIPGVSRPNQRIVGTGGSYFLPFRTGGANAGCLFMLPWTGSDRP